MRIHRTDRAVTVRDRPEPEWMLGAFLALGGLFGLVMVFADPEGAQFWERVLIALIAGGVLAGGIYLLATSPRTTTKLNAGSDTLTVTPRGLWRRPATTVRLEGLKAIVVAEQEDSEGSPVWRIELETRDGHRIPLSQLWRHGHAELESIASQLRQEVAKRLPIADDRQN